MHTRHCEICSDDERLVDWSDNDEQHLLCADCHAALTGRAENPAKWQAFILKHGDGCCWFEHLPLPIRPLNKLQCK